MSKYMTFNVTGGIDYPLSAAQFKLINGKTWWAVSNKKRGYRIGIVRWDPDWNQFVFDPNPSMQLSAECLRDIAGFCEERTKEAG